MKTCNRCRATKDIEHFPKNGKCGWHPVCKPCQAEKARLKRLESPELVRSQERARSANNRESRCAASRAYYEKNAEARKEAERLRYMAESERIRARNQAYREANRHKVYEWNGTRRAMLRQAVPAWADRAAIRAIYADARRLTQETGVEHHVDHEIPLAHPMVCGLHVPANLRVLTAQENMRKSNAFAEA